MKNGQKIGYARVSTREQNLDLQLDALKAAGCYQIFTDHGISGAAVERDGLTQALDAIGEGDTLLVWKLDRLARSQQEGINTLCDWCEKGVRVVSVTQQIDLSGTVGRVVAGVLFGIAEIEKQRIQERQAAGIADAKQSGVYQGRKAGTTKARPRRAKKLQKQGLKNKEIAQALWVTPRTVSNYLKA